MLKMVNFMCILCIFYPEKSSKQKNKHTLSWPSISHQLLHFSASFKSKTPGFPGCAVVENPSANAGDTGSSPGPGRSHVLWSSWARVPLLLRPRSRAHKPQLLSPRAATTEAHVPRARAPRGYHSEKPTHRNKEWPPLSATRESPRAATKTQRSQN